VEHSHRAAVILARVSDQLSGAERLEQLDAALKLAREQWRGQVDALRIKALAEVGSRLPDPDPVLTEALDAALARDRFGQGSSIAEIARLLTPRLLRKALSQLQTIQDRVESCRVLAEAAVACRGEAGTRIGHTACGSIAKIDEVHKRWAALLRLLRVREIRSELIVLLARTADEMTGEQWASEEALALPDPLDDEIAEIALRAAQKNPDARAAFVTALAPCISDRLFASVTELAAKIEDAERRDSAFAAIAPRAPKERIAVLVEVCANPEHDGSDRLRAAVAKRLAELGQHEGAMSLARRIKDREQRLPVFASIANAAPDPQPAIAEIIEHLNALTWRPPLLYVSRIAGMLPQELAAPVLLAAREWAVRVQNDRDTILEDIAGPLAETGLVAEARSAAEDIADAAKKVRALTAVSNAAPEPARSDALKRALDLANEMPEELRKSLALAELLPHLAESDCERVSSRIDIQALAAEQPTWVADIVPQLLPTRAHELLRLDRDEINAAVVEHTRDLPADEVRILWESANHRAGARTRPGALVSLRLTLPWIHHLGGHTALERICQAITDVTRWWP
jgi:hypothetical protein